MILLPAVVSAPPAAPDHGQLPLSHVGGPPSKKLVLPGHGGGGWSDEAAGGDAEPVAEEEGENHAHRHSTPAGEREKEAWKEKEDKLTFQTALMILCIENVFSKQVGSKMIFSERALLTNIYSANLLYVLCRPALSQL